MLPNTALSFLNCSLIAARTFLRRSRASRLLGSCSRSFLRSASASSWSPSPAYACARRKRPLMLAPSFSSTLVQAALAPAKSFSFSCTAAMFPFSATAICAAFSFWASSKSWSESTAERAFVYFWRARGSLASLKSALPSAFFSSANATFSPALSAYTSLAFSSSTSSTSYDTAVLGGTVARERFISRAPKACFAAMLMSAFSFSFIFMRALSRPAICCSSSTTQRVSSPSGVSSNLVPSGR
mmetsp:Transcript_26214/g.56875  ORF Transcript_26214/g.56875 Transcript_26214/m.56875 type:complete len:242 (+) Transcript_26214:674-1399(+)